MEKPQGCYPIGLTEGNQLILKKLDYIIFQNEENKKMDEATKAALAELKTDFDAIAKGIDDLNTKITGDDGALAAKDATIAELQKQVADGFAQDDADKASLATLQAADAAATQDLKDTLSPLVTQADALAASFATVVPPAVDPGTSPVVNTPTSIVPIEDQPVS